MSSDWEGPDGRIGQLVTQQSEACLDVYRTDPLRVEEDAKIELTAAEGGYGRKQVFELIQNAADALKGSPGRVQLVLTDRALYVANGGHPFNEEGVKSLLASHLSRKSDEQIGQFGLGFKSVLAVTDGPVIVSRSGSFKFDRASAKALILQAGICAPRYPVLRLATPIDAANEQDAVLENLMSWAATIVKLPLKTGRNLISQDMTQFPPEFLLFSPAITELVMDDRTGGGVRTIQLSGDATAGYVLNDGEKQSSWHVTSRTHRPSKLALKDAGELGRREVVEVVWASPASGAGLGAFWAYFPTQFRTTLSGIINAPWKLSSDRLTILEGPFNEELLLEVLPSLVADGISRGYRQDDPAALVDVLPARGREERSWADDLINAPIFERVAKVPCVPDMNGLLHQPNQLRLHPKDLPQEWKSMWRVAKSQRRVWVHHDVDQDPTRRLKVERLIQSAGGDVVSLATWLEAMVVDAEPQQCAQAVILAARILRERPTLGDAVRAARIVLLDDGSLVRPQRGRVFVRSGEQQEDHAYVHPGILSEPGVEDALGDLGIEVLDASGKLRAALQATPLQAPQWRSIWTLIREVEIETALSILRDELPAPLVSSVYVQMKSGKWWPIQRGFLAGEVIPGSATRDADYLVDPGYHAEDLAILQRIGAVTAPRLISGLPDEPWLRAYRQRWSEQYIKEVFKGKVDLDQIEITGESPPWPLEMMSTVSEPARVVMSQAVLLSSRYAKWTVRHKTKRQEKGVVGPAVQRLKTYGFLPTSIGDYPARACLHPYLDDDPNLDPDVLPVAQISSPWADALELPRSPATWSQDIWDTVLAETERNRPDTAPRLYVVAAGMRIAAPERILAHLSGHPARVAPGSAAVTIDAEKQRSLGVAGLPCLLVADDASAELLQKAWGLADAAEMLREEVLAVPDAEPVLMIDRFPPLKLYYNEVTDLEQLEIQTCSAITVLVSTPTGQVSSNRPYHRADSVINVMQGSDTEILRSLSTALRIDIDIPSILKQTKDRETNQLRIAIRNRPDVEGKLVAAVGLDRLRRHLPQPAVHDLEQEVGRPLTDMEVARLCVSVHGYSALSELRQELDDEGLEPPRVWAGASEARRFVESLGFPPEYAGSPGNARPPKLEVPGPIVLPELHDYQRRIVDSLHTLIGQTGRRRGLISLPTGAGKTRVAVQGLIELACMNALAGTVVWIAQSDELCEQAVQSWAEVWRALGPPGQLVLSRFWGPNDVDEVPDARMQVVVATIDKLGPATGKPQYDWLTKPSLIVIDEAHGSISQSYSEALRWLGGDERVTRVATPLIGLTATPYRGTNEAETKQLVSRYDGCRLDDGVFGDVDPFTYLQGMGVLAGVSQHLLKGVDIEIGDDFRRQMEHFGGRVSTLPATVEESLGKNTQRNRAIVGSIAGLPSDWPILVFASSVENARVLAAELSYHGISASPIVQTTPPALRRHYIEAFRHGDVRVLTNYQVLTQGFDAPRVRAVYVTRPTFSPNLYQQMIGRGLRGPLNGGSDECLIVNVEDNLSAYGDRLAFRHFEYLWNDRD